MSDEKGDFDLMEALAARDVAALRLLFSRHAPVMLGVANRILADRHEAEELVNEVFFEAWQRADRFVADRSAPRTYLLLMTRSRAIDKLRRRPDPANPTAGGGSVGVALGPDHLGVAVDDGRSPPEAAEASELRANIDAALLGLSEVDRESVVMSFFDGLTHAEIAEQTGQPLGTVKGRIRRGLMRLREALRRAAGPREGGEQ